MEVEFQRELNSLKERLTASYSVQQLKDWLETYNSFLQKYGEHITNGSGISEEAINMEIDLNSKNPNLDLIKKNMFSDISLVKLESGGFRNAGE